MRIYITHDPDQKISMPDMPEFEGNVEMIAISTDDWAKLYEILRAFPVHEEKYLPKSCVVATLTPCGWVVEIGVANHGDWRSKQRIDLLQSLNTPLEILRQQMEEEDL